MDSSQSRILLVDDCDTTRNTVSGLLQRAGFAVHEAPDAQEALRQARQGPDLVLLDLKSAAPAARQLCRRLKSEPETASIPVLQVNAADSIEKLSAIEAGVDGWLARPVHADELLAHIRLLLKLRKTQQHLRLSNERLCSLLGSITDAYFRLDSEHRVLMLNTAAAHVIFNREPEDLVGCLLWDTASEAEATDGFRTLLEAVRAREQTQFDTQFAPGQWFEVRVYPTETEVEVFLRDITQRKQSEEQLRRATEAAIQSQQILNALMEYIPIGISVTTGPKAIARAVSRYTQDMLGVEPGELIGKPICERMGLTPFFHTDGATPARSEELPLSRAARSGEVVSEEEWLIKRPDGEMVAVLYTAAPIRDAEGRIIGSVGGFQDITERRRALAAVQEQKDKLAEYANLVELANILILDLEGRIVFWNKGAEEMYGWSKAEAIGQNAHQLLQTQFPQPCAEIKRSMLEEGCWQGELVHTTRSGRQIVLASRWRLHRNASGEPKAIVEINADITSQRRAEEALAAERAFLRKVLDTSSAFIMVLDENERYTMVNEAAARLLGTTMDRIIGRTPLDFVRSNAATEQIKVLIEEDRRVIQERRSTFTETEITSADGSPHWFSTAKAPLVEPDGSCHQVLVMASDITNLKIAQNDLTAAKEALSRTNANLERLVEERTAELQQSVAELENFSYSLTHDMRAPLRAMHGFAQILERDCSSQLPPRVTEYLRLIKSNSTRMDNLIRDALNYSKLMRGEMRLEAVDTDELLRGMIETYPSLQPPNAEVHIKGRLPSVFGNSSALTQCFSMLLDNAVKYVAPGVKPRVRIFADTHEGSVRLWFVDNGVGIPEDSKERIFTLFERLDVSIPGTGLGLALVRKSIDRMGGRVGVESEPGRGSRFWIELKPAQLAGLQRAA